MTEKSQEQFLKEWAQVVIKMWEGKMNALDIYDTGELFNSFVNHIMAAANGDISKIDFIFKEYGLYVDMGVGKEISKGNDGDLSDNAYFDHSTQSYQMKRKAKPWYSKVFFREVMKLKEFLAKYYAKEAACLIAEGIESAFDQRYNKQSKTVSSLRTVAYRDSSNARRRKNYLKKQMGDKFNDINRGK
jgi:hypothetical protein